MPTIEEVTSLDAALDATSERVAHLVHEVTGAKWHPSKQALHASPFAATLRQMNVIAQMPSGHVLSEVERTTVRDEVQHIRDFLLNSLVGGVVHVPQSFEESYFGKLINEVQAHAWTMAELYSVSAAAERLNVPRATLTSWRRDGRLEAVVIDGRTHYMREQVEALAAQRGERYATRGRPGRTTAIRAQA